jgi:FkbM family methyltransferase
LAELSYSQNMEDYHLSLAFAGQGSGTYIDIGAGHPIADNVSFWFYERGWQGLVVEPQAELIDLYVRLRPRDRRFCGLVGRQCGIADFHSLERFHGLSTTVEQYARAAAALGVPCRTLRLPMLTLARLCEEHGLAEIDFLKVDVEGAEADVLLGGDWQRWRPKVVLVEAVRPGSGEPAWAEWEPFLLSRGYRFVLFDTLNRFYVAQEQEAIAVRLPAERAPWDAVRHMYEIGRAPENPRHPEHELAQVLARGLWASLPHLDADLLASLLRRGGGALDPSVIKAEPFRLRLGRIACGYDGGQPEPPPAPDRE